MDAVKKNIIEQIKENWNYLISLATAIVVASIFYADIKENFQQDIIQARQIEELTKKFTEKLSEKDKEIETLKSDIKLVNQKLELVKELDDEIRQDMKSFNHSK